VTGPDGERDGDPGPSLPPLPRTVRVSVVLPARDAADQVPGAIRSALHQDGVVEVLVAAGDPATAAASAEVSDPRVRVLDNPTGRTSEGLNLAIGAASGEVVVRVDAQSRLPDGYVAQAVASLRTTGAANVGGRQVPRAEEGTAAAIATAMGTRVGAGGATYRTGTTPGPADTVYLGVFRADVLRRVGGFDPRFVRNQDAELNLRLRRAGYTVWFEPRLAVDYRPRESLAALARQYLAYGRYRRLTAQVHPGSLAARQLAPPVLVGLLAATSLGSLIGRRPRLLGLVAGGYLSALASAVVVETDPPRRLPAVVAAVATMHVAWGIGFLLGPPERRRSSDLVDQRAGTPGGHDVGDGRG
jgi:succinoglycan biosynthesis protein ExoA